MATGPDALEKLQAEIRKQLGYTAHKETREMPAYALKVKNSNPNGLRRHDGNYVKNGEFCWEDISMNELAANLDGWFDRPLVDTTGLKGGYDVMINFNWNSEGGKQARTALRQAMVERLGIELVPTNLPVEVLVVEKVK